MKTSMGMPMAQHRSSNLVKPDENVTAQSTAALLTSPGMKKGSTSGQAAKFFKSDATLAGQAVPFFQSNATIADLRSYSTRNAAVAMSGTGGALVST